MIDREGLPPPRGPMSELLFAELEMGVHEIAETPAIVEDALIGDDLHLALSVCYELHLRGIQGIDGRWEWEPSLLALRADLEDAFEHALFEEVGPVRVNGRAPAAALGELVRFHAARRLNDFLDREGSEQHVRELALHRRVRRVGADDPCAFVLPRLPSGARLEAMELLTSDRFEGDRGERGARPMEPGPIDPLAEPDGALHLDRLPGSTLARANVASLFGLHRRWRGAAIGHLALEELCSPAPNRAAVAGLVGALVDAEPQLAADVLFGGRALIALERRFADRMLSAWARGASSLLLPD